MLLLCSCHTLVMFMSSSCHVHAILLSCSCHPLVMLMPYYCHTRVILFPLSIQVSDLIDKLVDLSAEELDIIMSMKKLDQLRAAHGIPDDVKTSSTISQVIPSSYYPHTILILSSYQRPPPPYPRSYHAHTITFTRVLPIYKYLIYVFVLVQYTPHNLIYTPFSIP